MRNKALLINQECPSSFVRIHAALLSASTFFVDIDSIVFRCETNVALEIQNFTATRIGLQRQETSVEIAKRKIGVSPETLWHDPHFITRLCFPCALTRSCFEEASWKEMCSRGFGDTKIRDVDFL